MKDQFAVFSIYGPARDNHLLSYQSCGRRPVNHRLHAMPHLRHA